MDLKYNNIEDSGFGNAENRIKRATFICKQFKKLQSSYSKDKTSANGINIAEVCDLFSSIKSDPSELSVECVAECVSAYVQLCLAICTDETEKNECLGLSEYCMFETYLKSNLELLHLSHLVEIYNAFFACRLRHPQTALFLTCEKLLQSRVTMVTEPMEVVSLCELVIDLDQQELWTNVEKCIPVFVDSMSLTQVLSCLQAMVNKASLDPNGVTNKELLSQLCSKVLEHEIPQLQLYHLTIIMSVMKKFSMADETLLQKLCYRIMQIEFGNAKQQTDKQTEKVCDLFSKISKFQYVHEDMIEMLASRLLILGSDSLSYVDVCSKVLINAAHLNLPLPNAEQIVQDYFNAQNRLKTKDQDKHIQVLWAFCMMGYENVTTVAEEIEALFKSTLPSSVEDDGSPNKGLVLMRQLRDMAMTNNIPLDSLTFLPRLQEMEQKRKSGPFEKVVCDAIEQSLPKGSCRRNVVTPAGHKIEIELDVTAGGKAVVKKDKTDLHRVAVKTRGYYTFSRPDQLPLGWVVMENKNLAKEGYTVVEIPYHEWNELGDKVDKSPYLLKKLQQAVSSKLV